MSDASISIPTTELELQLLTAYAQRVGATAASLVALNGLTQSTQQALRWFADNVKGANLPTDVRDAVAGNTEAVWSTVLQDWNGARKLASSIQAAIQAHGE